jgi:uncharacterized protein YbbC (DUF1343 family)
MILHTKGKRVMAWISDVEVEPRIDLKYLLDFYRKYADKENFFTGSFDRLAGTPMLQQQIRDGLTEEGIKATWQADLEVFKGKRMKYLLYD